ncbi:hypothetical protein HELRODRAFT_148668, partial [Helobdella robusta]|uniref:SAM domain-containing protein n=1 Tax=Helobdella robusta TaxID=6412 RepID=T1EKB5_HELRO
FLLDWLCPLGMHQYIDSFFDNGYDEMSVCRLIGETDLDAIGVVDSSHRVKILESV